jgi:hypothetical protein
MPSESVCGIAPPLHALPPRGGVKSSKRGRDGKWAGGRDERTVNMGGGETRQHCCCRDEAIQGGEIERYVKLCQHSWEIERYVKLCQHSRETSQDS